MFFSINQIFLANMSLIFPSASFIFIRENVSFVSIQEKENGGSNNLIRKYRKYLEGKRHNNSDHDCHRLTIFYFIDTVL